MEFVINIFQPTFELGTVVTDREQFKTIKSDGQKKYWSGANNVAICPAIRTEIKSMRVNENPTSWNLYFRTSQKHEAFRQLVSINFHGTYDSKDLYGSRLEHFAKSEVTNVLVRTEIFICAKGVLSLIPIDTQERLSIKLPTLDWNPSISC